MGWNKALWILAGWLLGGGGSLRADVPRDGAWASWLTSDQRAEIDGRLSRFYSPSVGAEALWEPTPKYDAAGRPVSRKPYLRSFGDRASTPLERLAQAKSSPEFQRAQCRARERFFPGFRCDGAEPLRWARIEPNDLAASLGRGWLKRDELVESLDSLPTAGRTDLSLWADDYWRWRFGGISYRYADGRLFSSYKDALAAYSQPLAWTTLLGANHPLERLASLVARWSPAEKYDLSVADPSFTLTLEQRGEGERQKKPGATEVEDWMGLCQGWAAASIRVPRPIKPVTLTGLKGLRVAWNPEDVRALTSLAWASGRIQKNRIGGRCKVRNPEAYPNGHLKDPACFDTNPATFLLALGNLIGLKKLSFVMDKAFDYEVWNQPVHSYQNIYFNPLHREQKNTDWKKVAVPYDSVFKAQDRFQKPLTRGKRLGPEHYDDGAIKQIVGGILTVTYLEEINSPPPWGPNPPSDEMTTETYTYDLEIAQSAKGQLVPTGGEWFQAAHPDFLWMPRKDSYPYAKEDESAPAFTGDAEPSPSFTAVAQKASGHGYPLCGVLTRLVNGASGSTEDWCY